MGYSVETYIGPFLRIREEYVKKPIRGLVCQNRMVVSWDVGESIGEALFFIKQKDLGDDIFWIPNVPRNTPRDFHIDEKEIAFGVLGKEINPDDEIEWFKKSFEFEIAKVREAYGDQNTKTEWGFFKYCIE